MALSSEDDVDANTEEAMRMLTARFWEAPMNAEMKEAIRRFMRNSVWKSRSSRGQ